MTHNWDYKPIGDCFVYIKNGANISQAKDSGGIPITRIETLSNGLFNRSKMGYANILEPGKYAQNVLNDGDLLMSHINSKSYIGRTVMYEALPNEVIIHGMNLLRLIPNETTLSKFFYYFTLSHYFKSKIAKIRKDAVNQSSFSITDLKKINIPVPPLAEQQQIVAELDKINETIEDCRELLRNLDALAQSLFYDFFGDPITNPKGWTLKQIKSFLSLKAGKAIKASELLCHISDGYYPCYGGNGIRGYISRKSHHGLYNIIGRQGALCGNVTLANSDFYATEHAVVVTPLIATSPYWLYYLLTALNLNQYAKGVAQPGLSVGVINEISIPVPPLELQEKFAARIEQIEAQKKVLENTIAELQTLLDSRMDYWFN